MNETLAHTVIILAGVIGYIVLTALGVDGNPVLAACLGYAGGAGVSKVTESK